MFFKLKRDDVSPAVARLVKTAKNPEPVLRAMGTTFKSITEGNFNSVGAAYRPEPWPAKADGSASNLQRSTTLSKSFQLTVTSTTATVSNPIYARVHQFGAIIKAVSSKALSWMDNGVRRFAKQVRIPARPFFPVTKDGRLTPMAEEKVLAAGKRIIDKQAGN
jgi:phage gpG-like protein